MEALQETLQNPAWKEAFLKSLRSTPRFRASARQDLTVCAVLRQYADTFSRLGQVETSVPTSGFAFEALTEEDTSSLLCMFQEPTSSIFQTHEGSVASSVDFRLLSIKYKDLLEEYDEVVRDLCAPDSLKSMSQLPGDTSTVLRKDLGEEAAKKGKKRKNRETFVTETADSSKETKQARASINSYSTLGTYTQLDNDMSRHKRISIANLHASEVLHAVSIELLKQGVDIFSDTKKLESAIVWHVTSPGRSLLQTLQQVGLRVNSSEWSAQLSPSVGRSASMVAAEYMRAWQDHLHALDTYFLQVKKDLVEKQKKRWESLSGPQHVEAHEQKLSLSDIPLCSDRIPNPFGAQGGDANGWNWMMNKMMTFAEDKEKGLEDLESDLSKRRAWPWDLMTTNTPPALMTVFSSLFSELREAELTQEINMTLWERAIGLMHCLLYDPQFPPPTPVVPKGVMVGSRPALEYNTEAQKWSREAFNATVQKALQTMEANLSPIILMKGYEHRRSEAAVHRGMVIGAIAAYHLGNPNRSLPNKNATSQEYQSNYKISTIYRNIYMNLFDKLQGQHNEAEKKRNPLNENWGPVLIVTKMRDIEAYEAGLGTVMYTQGIEIMPYHGSDTDRITLRSYLRSISSTGGLNNVGSGLYTERSHCHIVLTTYETLLLDAHYFKEFQWFLVVFDSPWGLFHNPRYSFPTQQILHSIRSRHRIFTSTAFTDENHLPDVFKTASLVCPVMLGLVCNMKEGVVNIPPDFSRPGVLLNNGSDLMQLDALSKLLLQRLLISTTVVCPLYDSVFLTDNPNTMAKWQVTNVDPQALCNDIMSIMPSLEWSCLDALVLPNGQTIGVNDNLQDKFILKLNEQSSHFLPAVSALSTRCNLHLMAFHGFNVSGDFVDTEMDFELQVVNMAMVGRSGNSLPRVVAENTGAGNDSALHFENAFLPTLTAMPSKRQHPPPRGRGRGRGRPKKNAEEPTLPTSESMASLTDVPIPPLVRSRGRPKGSGAGRGKGRAGRGGEASPRGLGVAAATNATLAEQEGADVGLPDDTLNTSDAMQVDEEGEKGADGVEEGEDEDHEQDQDASVLEDSMVVTEGNGDRALDTNTLTPSSAAPVAFLEDGNDDDDEDDDDIPMLSGKRLSVEEELSKYITKKGKVYIVLIIVAARQRYLGTFSEYGEAKKAFLAAYKDRENMLPADSSGTQMPGSAGCFSSTIKLHSKFKGRISRGIKLSDGSFVSNEYFRNFEDDGLYRDLKSMFYSTVHGGHSLSDWVTPHNTPPVFAMLSGYSQSMKRSIAIPIPSVFVVLGRASRNVSVLMNDIASSENDCLGMVYRCFDGLESLVSMITQDYPAVDPSALSNSIMSNKSLSNANTPLSAVHIGFDSSIAKEHAVLVFNASAARYEVLALQDIFVDGKKKTLQDGYTPLAYKTVLQIGTEIFYFLLPQQAAVCAAGPAGEHEVSSMLLRANLIKCAIASLPLRAVIWPSSYSDCAIASVVVQGALNDFLDLEYNSILAVSVLTDKEDKKIKDKGKEGGSIQDVVDANVMGSATKGKKRKTSDIDIIGAAMLEDTIVKEGEAEPVAQTTPSVPLTSPSRSPKKLKLVLREVKEEDAPSSINQSLGKFDEDQIDAALVLSSIAAPKGENEKIRSDYDCK